MGKVVFLVNMEALIVGFLGGSVPKVDIFIVVKVKRGNFSFWIASDAWRITFFSGT